MKITLIILAIIIIGAVWFIKTSRIHDDYNEWRDRQLKKFRRLK